MGSSGSTSADTEGGGAGGGGGNDSVPVQDRVYDPEEEAYIPPKVWNARMAKYLPAVRAAWRDFDKGIGRQKITVRRTIVGSSEITKDLEVPSLFLSSVEYHKELIRLIDPVAVSIFQYRHVKDRRQGQHAQCPDIGYQLQWRVPATETQKAELRVIFPSDLGTPDGRRLFEEFLEAIRKDNHNIYIG
jgi:hypothetical protein